MPKRAWVPTRSSPRAAEYYSKLDMHDELEIDMEDTQQLIRDRFPTETKTIGFYELLSTAALRLCVHLKAAELGIQHEISTPADDLEAMIQRVVMRLQPYELIPSTLELISEAAEKNEIDGLLEEEQDEVIAAEKAAKKLAKKKRL
jgi:hypothetical protein